MPPCLPQEEEAEDPLNALSTIPTAFTHINQLYHHHIHERDFIFILILFKSKLSPPPKKKRILSCHTDQKRNWHSTIELAFNILVAFNNSAAKISLIPKNLDPSHTVLWSLEMFTWRLNIFLPGFIPIKMKVILREKT